MNLLTERYVVQASRWPASGRHILAQFDAETIVVYQAYRPSIGRFAIDHQALGGPDFSFARMSWIKPNFLWMMYRSGWGAKADQETTLALRIHRPAFDELLSAAVASSYDAAHGARDEWQRAVALSDVRVQWDPDHGPRGEPLDRRALQLGLRGETLASFARKWIVDVQDMSGFVDQQRRILESGNLDALRSPAEHTRHETRLLLGGWG
jgi:hypothetical protein